MADIVYRLAYVVICCAGMVCFWLLCRWLIYGISDGFGIGFGAGFGVGMVLMYAITLVDKRDAQRRSKS
ncbi:MULTISPECIES: hypothetical protein [unclassified Rhizobium]|uniref:hypothetical protein n=1 Tax=unclassified Rhizobium TaxID=2613769 RepID=UPI001ADC6D28|nr:MULTISPECIES: hypothetical protein [unclassified Rhizobium]MBO9122795.1 hypothetical protein [Rhizobium sp. 16-488-2b]MBO9173327.1 hypothetical protein [Rhizobium sp. 16-488-2a]